MWRLGVNNLLDDFQARFAAILPNFAIARLDNYPPRYRDANTDADVDSLINTPSQLCRHVDDGNHQSRLQVLYAATRLHQGVRHPDATEVLSAQTYFDPIGRSTVAGFLASIDCLTLVSQLMVQELLMIVMRYPCSYSPPTATLGCSPESQQMIGPVSVAPQPWLPTGRCDFEGRENRGLSTSNLPFFRKRSPELSL